MSFINMKVSVKKLTDVTLLRRANSFTTGAESAMSLERAYAYCHSPIRTQLFWVECVDIPLYVASQLVRSHVGVQFFQLSKRPDRGGNLDFTEVCDELSLDVIEGKESRFSLSERIMRLSQTFDRMAPTDIAFLINAEALMTMSHKRLCRKASKETRQLMAMLVDEVKKIDEALARYLVPMCVYRAGLCTEPHSCGWNLTEEGGNVAECYCAMLRHDTKKPTANGDRR